MTIFDAGRTLTLLLVALPSCLEDPESYDDFDKLRPTQIGCSNCTIDVPTATAYLSLGATDDPDTVTDVTIEISNSSGTEVIPFGTTLDIPNYPDDVAVTDSQFCTVGSTGQPPTSAYIEVEFTESAGPYAVGSRLTLTGTGNCP